MKGSILHTVITILFVICLFSCSKSFDKEEIDNLFSPIRAKYGIEIVYTIDDDFDPIGLGGGRAHFQKKEPIEYEVLLRYPQILQSALEKYPVAVIKDYLSSVYLVKTLERNDFAYGGSYDAFRKIVYLANDGNQNDELSVEIFHHEFSSILLKKSGFFLSPWLACNPDGFKYFYETNVGIKEIYSHTIIGKTADYEDGFLNEYSRSDFENDFNEFSRMIFSHPKEFEQIMNQYPRIYKKFRLWLSFYQEIDPVFTMAYLFGSGK